MFRGAPLTITRHFLERFCMRAVHFVSQYNEALFVTFFIPCLFYKTSYDLSMGGGGGGHNPAYKFVLVGKLTTLIVH